MKRFGKKKKSEDRSDDSGREEEGLNFLFFFYHFPASFSSSHLRFTEKRHVLLMALLDCK
jgi:hypothetical protein